MAYDGIITIGIVPDDSQLTRTLRHLSTHTSRTINQAINAHTQPLGKISGEANEFQKSLAASNARVIAFGASTGILFAMKSAFQQLVKSTIDVEKQMTEVNSVFRLSSQQLKSFSNDLFALANNYGLSFSDASKAAVEFARQGNGVVETLKRTSAALALARISGLGMEESVNSLTSILNTFQKEGLEAMDVINRLTAVDQSFAISAGAMADALSRVSSSASDANVSLNETMGLIAAAKQITGRTGSVIGNSFKTMFTRLQRPEVLDDLESVGVKARDAQGHLRPMMDVLRALSSSYDGLASSQKSYIAETVGGVYQINILKAIMKDLGSGMSIVDGAMKVAGESTDFVNQRMEVLNETISSQLIRTANNLKLAFYNVGTSLVSGPLHTGLGNFDSLVRTVGKYTDPNTAKEGTPVEKFKANLSQGALKGVASFAAGPGLQFLMTTLLKLFERLDTFIIQSAKDLTGINTQEKQRQAINQGISEWLGTQKNLLADILNGQVSINTAMQMYLNDMKGAVSTAYNLKSVTESIGIRAITQVSFAGGGKHAAGGFIPNLEIAEARRGGYQAGRVLGTTVSDGSQSLNIVANSAESRTRVINGGKSYDFINPPSGSPAANLHRQESIRKTGIDPYDLPKAQMKGRGFIPNLALSPEMVQTIMHLGIDPKKIVEKARLSKLENFTSLPEDLVANFVSRYRHDTASLSAALVGLTKKGANIPINNGPAMAKFLSGMMMNQLARKQGLFPDMSNAAIATLTESLTGKEAQSPKAALAKVAQLTHLRPEDVQKVLDLHSKSIPFIAGYESPHDLSEARDRPNQVSSIDYPINPDTGEMRTFKIATPLYGFKGNLAAHFEKIEALMRAEAETDEPFTAAEMGTTRGVFFDKKLRAMAKREGVPVGETGSPLDIHGSVRSILSKTNIKSAVAAMELKASASGATDSGNMAEKLFRTFAGEPGTGGRKPALKGPIGYVPKLTNIQQFNAKSGGIGIIDADKYGQSGVTDAAFSSLIYAAVASGKPIRIHYGPMTMGKTTAAEHIVNKAGGLGGTGGDYITDIKQIDSDAFKQFIINKTDRKNLDTGVFGLALSSASQVRAFHSPYTEYKAKKEEMIKRLRERNRGQEGMHAESIAKHYDEAAWEEYNLNIQHLQKKLGPERVSPYDPENPSAGRGFIPNLALEDSYSYRIKMAREKRNFNPSDFDINMLPPFAVRKPKAESSTAYENRVLRTHGFIKSSNYLAYGPSSSVDGYKIRSDAIDLAEVKSDDESGFQSWSLSGVKDKFLRAIAENYKTGSGNQLTKALNKTHKIFGHLFAPPLVLGRKEEQDKNFIPNLAINDPYNKIVQLSRDNILKREVAKQASDFVNTTRDTKNRGSSFDREYLIAALYNHALGKPVGGDMKVISKTLDINDSMFEVLSEAFARKVNVPELRQRIKLGDFENAAGGFIPNLYNPIADALSRENKATGGNAVLSSHPLLRTNQNPMGFAAIDKRMQTNAGDAINQHMGLGQSLTSVRSAHTGFVPNLATSSVYEDPLSSNATLFSSMGMVNSLMLSLAGAGKQEIKGPGKFVSKNIANEGWLSKFASEGVKAVAKLQLLEEEFGKARQSLISEEDVQLSALAGGQKFSGTGPNKNQLLEEEIKKIKAPLNLIAEPYQKAKAMAAERASSIGLKTSAIASIGGGIAGQFAGTINPSLGEAVNEFSSGATQAGQILLTFPSRLGWIGAFAVAGGAAISSIDVWRRGMANATRNFELSHARFEQINSQLDTLAVSINQYDALILDSSVSLKSIETAQRQYKETLTQLRAIPETGEALANKIASAPDSKSQTNVLLEEKQKNVIQDNLALSLLALKKYTDKRSFLGAQSLFKIKPLGYSNLTEQHQVEGIVRGATSAITSSMSAELKGFLSTSKDTKDFTEKLNAALSNSSVEISSSAKEIVEAFRVLKDSVGDEETVNIQKRNIVGQFKLEAESNTPERQQALEGLKYRRAERQMQVESAINYARLQRRLFVNAGALNTTSQLNIQEAENQNKYDVATTYGPDSIARRQADTGLLKMQYGERTVKEYETATEMKRIRAETGLKKEQVSNEAVKTILGSLTQNFEQQMANTEQYKTAYQPGSGTPSLVDFKTQMLAAINQGISITAAKGAKAFAGPGGSIDTDKLIASIVKGSGATGENKDNVLRYLQANVGGVEIQRAMLDVQKQHVAISQQGNVESEKQTIALESFYRELNFKELAGYMGGIKNLLDRGSRRTMQRNLVRGAYLMERGRTSEARATGASLYLQSLKSMNIPLDPSKNTAISKSISQAFSILIPNLAAEQGKMAGRIANSNLLGRNSITGQAMQELYGRAGLQTAAATTFSEFPVENANLASISLKEISTSSGLFQTELIKSANALESFALNIGILAEKMSKAEIKMIQIREKTGQAEIEDAKKTFPLNPLSEKSIRVNSSAGKDTGILQKYGISAGEATVSIGSMAILGSAGYLAKRIWNNRKAQQLEQVKGQQDFPITKESDYLAMQKRERLLRNERIANARQTIGQPEEIAPFSQESAAKSAPEPPVSAPLNAKQKSQQYKLNQSLKERERFEARKLKAQKNIEFTSDMRERFKPKTIEEGTLSAGMPKGQLKFTKEPISVFSKGGGGRAAIATTLITLAAMYANSKLQASEAISPATQESVPKARESLISNLPIKFSRTRLGAEDISKTGIDTVANAFILKTPEISKLSSLKKGGTLALTGLLADKVQEILGGETLGKTVGGGINIAGALKFFGGKAGAGAAVGVGSELLRPITEKKFGYGAGLAQGFAGSAIAGAGFGPWGAAIAPALYTAGEAMQVNQETNEAIGEGNNIDVKRNELTAFRNERAKSLPPQEQAARLLSRLTGRTNELTSLQQTDERDSSGFYGHMIRPFSAKQFGESQSKELSQINAQKTRLTSVLGKGDSNQILKVLQDIQAELANQTKLSESPDSSKSKTQGAISSNSQINVDISVKDLDRIPSEINDSVIGPLVEQISQLQIKVNELINQQNPRPASMK